MGVDERNLQVMDVERYVVFIETQTFILCYATETQIPYPILSTCPLYTNGGCGEREAH